MTRIPVELTADQIEGLCGLVSECAPEDEVLCATPDTLADASSAAATQPPGSRRRRKTSPILP